MLAVTAGAFLLIAWIGTRLVIVAEWESVEHFKTAVSTSEISSCGRDPPTFPFTGNV